MAKIVRATKKGQPGFSTRSVEGYTGQRVPADGASKRSIRTLLARNPAKHQDNPLGFTNHPDIPNPNSTPRPRILNGTILKRAAVILPGVKSVRNRSLNRRITKR